MKKNEFIESPINKRSLAHRKKVYGVGVNDSDYVTNVFDPITGKQLLCPYYRRWKDMLTRCYSHKSQAKCPTYIGCAVSNEWLLFSNFKAWMIKQDWEGNDLDKDIIQANTKLYSHLTCRFIPQSLNKLLTDSAAKRGKYPLGVSLSTANGKYHARCSVKGKARHLGYYLTVEEAEAVYINTKIKEIRRHQRITNDIDVYRGLDRIVESMELKRIAIANQKNIRRNK